MSTTYYMPTCVFHIRKQFTVVVSGSLIGQSSLSFNTVLHMFEHVLFHYQRQGVVCFYYHKQFSVVVSDSLIVQSSLSFITVLQMFEHVWFYYQRQGVV